MSSREYSQCPPDTVRNVRLIHLRSLLLSYCASAGLLCTAWPALAQAGAAAPSPSAPAGPSPFSHPYDDEWTVGSHSPSGLYVRIPPALPTPRKTESGWEYTGYATVDFLSGEADTRNALFRQYRDFADGINVSGFGVRAYKPGEARYIEFNAARVSQSDQSYVLRAGRYNDWQVTASHVGTPHIFTEGYHSLWDGVGSGNLVLRAPLTPGGTGVNATDNADVAAVAAGPEMTLSLTREKSSVRYDLNIGWGWKAYASYSHEERKGARPFGAVWGAGGGTAPKEIAEPIDYTTHDMQFGMVYADTLNALNVKGSASLFRNNIDTLTYQEPYRIPLPAGVSLPAGRLYTQGRLDLYPDSNAYNLSADYARQLPNFFDGRLTAVVAAGTARQDDNLIPYTTLPGLALANVVGGGWDTTGSLSRTTSDARADTLLGDLTLQFLPLDGLNVTLKAHYFDNANKTAPYYACNPSATYVDNNPLLAGSQAGGLTADGCTGVWGRLLNDGSGVNVIIGANTTPAGNLPIQSSPFSNEQYSFSLTADYRLPHAASLNAGVEHEVVERTSRERRQTSENRLSLGYVNNAFFDSSLRLSYQYAQRRGSMYVAAPNVANYSGRLIGMPDVVGTNVQSWAVYNNAGLRMYDLADRNQHTFNLRLNSQLSETLDASVTALVRKVDYPGSEYGRRRQNQNSINLDINYQPAASQVVHAAVGYQDGRSDQATIPNGGTCNIGQVTTIGTITSLNAADICSAPGGPIYALNSAWYAMSKDRNFMVGFGAEQRLGDMRLTLDYTRTYGRSGLNYDYNPGGAIAVATAPLAGSGWPDLETLQDSLDVGLTKPIGENAAIGLGYRLETGDIEDWHYRGLDTTHVVTGAAANLPTAVILDSGPRDYRVHIARLTLEWRF